MTSPSNWNQELAGSVVLVKSDSTLPSMALRAWSDEHVAVQEAISPVHVTAQYRFQFPQFEQKFSMWKSTAAPRESNSWGGIRSEFSEDRYDLVSTDLSISGNLDFARGSRTWHAPEPPTLATFCLAGGDLQKPPHSVSSGRPKANLVPRSSSVPRNGELPELLSYFGIIPMAG